MITVITKTFLSVTTISHCNYYIQASVNLSVLLWKKPKTLQLDLPTVTCSLTTALYPVAATSLDHSCYIQFTEYPVQETTKPTSIAATHVPVNYTQPLPEIITITATAAILASLVLK